MAITAPVYMSALANEFGMKKFEPYPKLSHYYRGGDGLIPDYPQNAGVATSPGALRLSHFVGASNVAPSLAKSGDAIGTYETFSNSAPASRSITTNTVTISGSGLSSISWSLVSGTAMTVNASGLTASFTGTVSRPSASRPSINTVSAIYRATGNTGAYIDVNVTLQYIWDTI